MSAPCIAVSDSADFEDGTWTFRPVLTNFAVGAGRYAIIREREFVAIEQQRDELLAAMIDIQQVACSGSPELGIATEAIAKAKAA